MNKFPSEIQLLTLVDPPPDPETEDQGKDRSVSSSALNTQFEAQESALIHEDSPFPRIHSHPLSQRIKQVWAIGGGKGGVGKSLVSSNISISLARAGFDICAIDLDLGAANLHTLLGVDLPKETLSDFLTGRVDNLNACRAATPVEHLKLISGAHDSVEVANIGPTDRARIMEKVREIDCDYALIDLGAGTSSTTVDLFLSADVGILTLLPEPTSIENAYRLIKALYFRSLSVSPKLASVRDLILAAMDPQNALGLKTPADLYREVNRISPETGLKLKEAIERFRPKIIVNQARTQSDIDIGYSVKSVCKKYFGIEVDYLGYLEHDNAVWQAVRRKRPLALEFPNSKIVSSLDRIAQHLIKRHSDERSGVLFP